MSDFLQMVRNQSQEKEGISGQSPEKVIKEEPDKAKEAESRKQEDMEAIDDVDIEESIYQGHEDLVDLKALFNLNVLMVGAGSIGSFAAIAMAKMGIKRCTVVDFDTIELHNQANQIYNWHQEGLNKVDCLCDIIKQYSEEDWEWNFSTETIETGEQIDNLTKQDIDVINLLA